LPGYLVIKLLLIASSIHLEQGSIDFLSLCIASLLYAFIGALFATGYPRLGKLMLAFIQNYLSLSPSFSWCYSIHIISRGNP